MWEAEWQEGVGNHESFQKIGGSLTRYILYIYGRRGGLMVSALDSGSGGPGSG